MDTTKRMSTGRLLAGGLFACLYLWPALAAAVPTLQLDLGADAVWYDDAGRSVVTDADDFTVYALLTPGPNDDIDALLGQTYYISIALTPALPGPYDPTLALGSFFVDGEEIQVVADMVYGVPPIENALDDQPRDSGDLPKHGIYPTYFLEVGFTFSRDDQTATYNVKYDPGAFAGDVEDGGTYYASFEIASASLDGPYGLHIDLYNDQLKEGDTDVGIFAPCSHEAERVPEPGSLWLLGMGAVGLVWVRKRA